MEVLHQIATLVATLLGTTPDKLIALVFGVIMAPVTMTVTGWLNKQLTGLTWLTEEITGKIKGTVMTVISSVVAYIVIYAVGWLFGVDFMSSESVYIGVIGALGVNQTVASWLFHRLKAKDAAAQAAIQDAIHTGK